MLFVRNTVRFLILFGAVSIALSIGANLIMAQGNTAMSSALQPPNSEGAMEGVNLQRTNYYPGAGVELTNTVIWKSPKYFVLNYDVPQLKDAALSAFESVSVGFSDPVLANGLLYFRLTRGVRQHCLFAIDQSNGVSVWRFESKVALSSPAIASNQLYVESADGIVYAFDASTGREVWRYSVKGEQWTIGAAPAVADGVLYVSTGSGNLYALDIQTRQPRWVFKAKGALTSPTLVGGSIYVGSDKGYVYAVDRKSGEEQWNVKVKSRPDSPVAVDGSIYLRTQEGVLWALDAKTGQEKWNIKSGGKVRSAAPTTSVTIGTSLAVHNQKIYFGGAQDDINFLYAIDAANGQERWQLATGGACRAPVVNDDTIYIGCQGKLFAVDAQSGKSKWELDERATADGQIVKAVPSSPALANGRLYFFTDEGFVYALGK